MIAAETEAIAPAQLQECTRAAVAEVVQRQVSTGIDVVNDGEASKFNYATYVQERLTGFGGHSIPKEMPDVLDFPQFAERIRKSRPRSHFNRPACVGPIAVRDADAVHRDIANIRAALDSLQPADAFLTAASPGVVSYFFDNHYYPTHEAYLYALADAMKYEYEAIAETGFLLQVDCPDLAMGRHILFPEAPLAEFREYARLHVEVLNYALAGIPADRLRMHLCWGNMESPHHRDVPLADILDIVMQARPAAISFEGANPRHAHEWTVFERLDLPDDKIIMPGVIDSTTNYIEHPELVAQRIVNYARVVGPEQVLAGTDCGLSSSVTSVLVDPDIA